MTTRTQAAEATRAEGPRRTRTAPQRLVAGTAASALLAAGIVAIAPVASPASAADAVTVRLDPSYQQQEFEGWGTSLVWFANATGDYPDEIRNKLADMVFGEDGLNLNIARYNIGGGNAPDVVDYLRPGGAVEGWWKAPEGTTRNDTSWFDAGNPDHWNLDADQTQRWWIDRIKGDVDTWEAFSNSPPYFQTVSGYVSGGFNSSADQLKTSSINDFVNYLVTVTDSVEEQHGIQFDTIDPFNEPNTNYWGTTLVNGEPTGGRQEGAHMGPALQQQVLAALDARLQTADTDAAISAMDETNPGTFLTNWNSYSDTAKASVDQLNVHTYGTGSRTAVRDVAKGTDKPLWMSEVEGSWGTGQNFTSMVPGLGMAERIASDLRELEPSAWVFWQPVEDYDNMKPGGESAAGANWGSIQLPFNCDAEDTLATCPIYSNTKYDTVRNYTHYIKPGDHVIGSNNAQSTAAIRGDETGATVVHINDTAVARDVTLDLSRFGTIAAGATVTPVVTSEGNPLVQGTPVAITGTSATLTVPAQSVTSFVIDGVSGVAEDAALAQDGHVYRLTGSQSSKALAPGATAGSAVIKTVARTSAEQYWTLTKVTDGNSNRERYTLGNAATGQVLNAPSQWTAQLIDPPAQPQASAQWILSTTGTGTYTLVNAQYGTLLEVGGQATTDNAPVSLYQPNSGTNQLWTISDETITGIEPVRVFTAVGTAPALPATVTPVLRSGSGTAVPVTWQTPDPSVWNTAGTVTVDGTIVDAVGTEVPVTATVIVSTVESAKSVTVKTYTGHVPTLPATVSATTASGEEFDASVDWAEIDPAKVAAPGVFTVTGAVTDTLSATATVQVTNPGSTNTARDSDATVAATYTESGYPASRLVNGNTTEKGWSNWRSGTKNTSETVTFGWQSARDVTSVKVYFYRDGATSYPERFVVQAKNSAGNWVDASASTTVPASGSPVIDVPVTAVATDGLRLQFTIPSANYLTLSEIEVSAKAPGVSSDATLAGLTADGSTVQGFDAGTTAYKQVIDGPAPTVAATATDPFAAVEIAQASDSDDGRVATATVTAEDGETAAEYTVTFESEFAEVGTPTIDGLTSAGDAQVGASLTASPGEWKTAEGWDADINFEYQWLRGGEAIEGADSDSYTPVAADLGGELTVLVTGTAAGHVEAAATSAAADVTPKPVTPALISTSAPTIKGTAKVGRTLTATAGSWNATGVSVSYRWLRNGASIPGATSSKYLATTADAGKRLTVQVTAAKSGYTTGSATSTATAALAKANTSTTLKVSTKSVKAGKKVTLTATVAAPGASKVKLSGTVTFYSGSTKAGSVSVKGAAGKSVKVSTKFTPKGKGTVKIRAVYKAGTGITGSTSSWNTLKVTRK